MGAGVEVVRGRLLERLVEDGEGEGSRGHAYEEGDREEERRTAKVPEWSRHHNELPRPRDHRDFAA